MKTFRCRTPFAGSLNRTFARRFSGCLRRVWNNRIIRYKMHAFCADAPFIRRRTMRFTVASHSRADAAQLSVCTPARPAAGEAAALLAAKLDDKTSFAAAQIALSGSLKAAALLRLADDNIETLQKGAKEAAAWAQKQDALSIDLGALDAAAAARAAAALLLALGEAVYRFDHFKAEKQPAALAEAEFVHADTAALQAALDEADALLYGINLCKDLGNMPPNVCTPTYLAERGKTEAEQFGASAKILGGDYIRENMPSFWSVAKGSVQEPKLLELSWQGAANAEEAPVVLVGKGLTFDSGGISLKPGEGMDEMKYDMCGAASVIGTFVAAAKARLPINLRAVVATCENMPDGGSCKPGDIVATMNGTTVENLNTDAEGRLVLCDALTYSEQFQPAAVIDVATLTGACIIALGHIASGLMANHQPLADSLAAAAKNCNDKVWQLPLFAEYKEQLKSNFADLQNIGGRPAGTITAATFLAHFAQNYHWAHLDIAGTAWKSGKEKGATGRPVPLLMQFLRERAAA